jgi:anaerobic magnesium-protoporphyrin IX monomethyl ester cyclase
VRLLLIPSPSIHLGAPQPYVPLGILSLQAVAHRLGHAADVLSYGDLVRSNRVFGSSEDLAAALADAIEVDPYDAIGLSAMCSGLHHSLNLIRLLKARRPDLPIWLGGPHASLCAEQLLEAYPEIDAVFVGESEETLREVLESSSHGRLSVLGIRGIANRGSPAAPRKPISNLDDLPFLDEATGFHGAWESARGNDYPDALPLEAERGCPGACGFCSTRLLWSLPPRRKSNTRMITEMRRLHRITGMTHFSLIGDNFASPHERLLDFCDAMKIDASGFNWYCHLKLDRLAPEDLSKLWRGGCRGFFAGLESASQSTLDRVNKGTDLRRELEVVFRAVDLGFYVVTSFIIGFPWETASDIDQTYALHADLLKRGVSRSLISVLCPLPGTQLLQEYCDHFEPFRGISKTAVDGLPFGAETWEMIKRCPELFTQLGYFRNGASWTEVAATADAAQMLTTHHMNNRRDSAQEPRLH